LVPEEFNVVSIIQNLKEELNLQTDQSIFLSVKDSKQKSKLLKSSKKFFS